LVESWTYYPASTAPNARDIAWCRFPDSDELKPGPKPRPALIRRVLKNPRTGRLAVEVAFGTSNLKLERAFTMQLIVGHPNDLREAGLHIPTRFDLRNTKILPWAKEFFAGPRPGNAPIVGRLSAQSRLDLIELLRR
jgi:hypothetical protein